MIEIQPLTAVLAIEVIIALTLALVAVTFRASRKRRSERDRADHLVERISRAEESHLTNLTSELCDPDAFLAPSARRQTVETVNQREKALYRHVIQAFLTRDAAKLEELDRYVRGISEPYCQLVQELIRRGAEFNPEELQARIAALETQVRLARTENARLRTEMERTLTTLDEVSKEYTKMFGSEETAADLHASRARMLDHFRRATAAGPQQGAESPPASEEARSP